jgi:hypothetical protein
MVQVAGQLLLCYEYRCTVGCFLKLAKKGQNKAARINHLHHHTLLKRKQKLRKCHYCVERLSSRTLVLMSTQTLPSRKDVPRIDVSVSAFCVCVCVCVFVLLPPLRSTTPTGKQSSMERCKGMRRVHNTQHAVCMTHKNLKY